ncbi:MAG TPA: CinA family nicotinamide mononucleotide deamidase-related protein [Stellaceae bacterium]|nr:CinA family nicotinamide mononucleotide deamidase-related protein [Stellaceae bacterium]
MSEGRDIAVEVICTGDEVLTGKVVNTNYNAIAQRLEEVGIPILRAQTIGDDRATLAEAFRLAGARSDAVIVNGGLGPTVDDLSQEVAAEVAGVPLVLNELWLARMEERFRLRSRIMPANNRKQAMLPEGAELVDNPIGTACGFALDIGKARFFFTPGVPRELFRMLDEQVVPRLLARAGRTAAIFLKRFHSYGLGESHVDALLKGVEELAPAGAVKLGFRAHYPQLETKLAVRGRDREEVARLLAPVEAEVRKRLGNFILAEDDETLEGNILAALKREHLTLAVAETFTGGQISARISPLPGAETVFRHGIVQRHFETGASALADSLRRESGATHALAAFVTPDEGTDRFEFGGAIELAIASSAGVATRTSRIVGGRDWVRLGAVEMGLDCLRRYLLGLPVSERIDFEKV